MPDRTSPFAAVLWMELAGSGPTPRSRVFAGFREILGLSIAKAFMRATSVDGLTLSSSAAPPRPEIFQFARRSALSRFARSISRHCGSAMTSPRLTSARTTSSSSISLLPIASMNGSTGSGPLV